MFSGLNVELHVFVNMIYLTVSVTICVLCLFGVILFSEYSLSTLNISKIQSSVGVSGPSNEWQPTQSSDYLKKRFRRDVAVEVPCQRRSRRELFSMLSEARAFNLHYASIAKPIDFMVSQEYDSGGTGSSLDHEDRFPNWSDLSTFNFSRASFAKDFAKRSGDNPDILFHVPYELPWTCPRKLKWIDLGADTFPRYMRTAVCTKSCWFERMVCQPRAFIMVVLKRKNSRCFLPNVITAEKKNMAIIPRDLQEDWEPEEIAVNFCCECVRKKEDSH